MSSVAAMYAQYSYETEAYIVGNREGLIELRNALDRAINASSVGARNTETIDMIAPDGEEYDMHIICNRTPWGIDPSWMLHSHYTAEHTSTEGLSDLSWPADLTLDEFQKFVK